MLMRTLMGSPPSITWCRGIMNPQKPGSETIVVTCSTQWLPSFMMQLPGPKNGLMQLLI